MRVLLDANVLLDCLVLESSGQPRTGKMGSDQVLMLCDSGVHQGLVAWHTLPILAYYYERQHTAQDTALIVTRSLPWSMCQLSATQMRSCGEATVSLTSKMRCK